MSSALQLVVRTVHLLGMVALVGGSVLAWYGVRSAERVPGGRLLRFELWFWALLGLVLATGVGNLGAVGAPGPGTRWGTVLTAKLLVVLAFVVGSFLRSLAVLRLPADATVPDRGGARLERAYGATAATLLLLVAIAEVLAHG